MVFPAIVVCAIGLNWSGGPKAAAQDATESLRYKSPYSVAKPVLTRAFDPTGTVSQRRSAVLAAARVAYGSRAAGALGDAVDTLARTPGGQSLASHFAVDNRNVQKGALRTARVAAAFDRDPRFRVVAVEEWVRDSGRRTDRDIVYRHRASSSRGRIEVKDVGKPGQRSNLLKYKRQIRLMSLEQLETGQPQAFVNRRTVIPALKQYAERRGVAVYENVVTSRRGAQVPGATRIEQVLDDLNQKSNAQLRGTALATSVGTLVAFSEGSKALAAWRGRHADPGMRQEAVYHGLLALSGAAFAVRGPLVMTTRKLDPTTTLSRVLSRTTRIARPAGVVLLGTAAAYRTAQWMQGEMNNRQFAVYVVPSAGEAAGAFSGAWAGGIAGAKIGGGLGALVGPEGVPLGAAIGGFAGLVGGGLAGAWFGETIASSQIEAYFDALDETQRQRLFQEVREHYASQLN